MGRREIATNDGKTRGKERDTYNNYNTMREKKKKEKKEKDYIAQRREGVWSI